MLQLVPGSTLLIHHWDTDGICSAALLLEYLKDRDIETWTPPLGTFYQEEEHIKYAQRYDNVIICDIAFPASGVQEIAEKSNVIMIDHHHQEPISGVNYINPVAKGAEGDKYPSNTWVIKEVLGLPVSLKVVLGFVGDREQKIKDNPPFWKIIEQYSSKEGINFEELLQLVYRIDSSYKVGDRQAVTEAPHLLRAYNSDQDILGNKRWENNLVKLDEKLEQVLSEPPETIDRVQVKRLNTPYVIISQVTRRLAWETGKDTVDMRDLIMLAKKKGYNAGGKKDVIGAIIPKPETEKFLAETIEYIKKWRD